MNKLLIGLLFLGSVSSVWAATGFLVDQRLEGRYRICYYRVLGDIVPVTLDRTDICPVNLQFN